jgi:hypothetical protein
MFRGVEGKRKEHLTSKCFCKDYKSLKILKYCFGGGSIIGGFSLFAGGFLKPNPHGKRGMSIHT